MTSPWIFFNVRHPLRVLAPGQRAWSGATWGISLITILIWGANAYYGFAPAGIISFGLATLVILLAAAIAGGILLGVGWLLRRMPARYRWAGLSALLPLSLAYLAPPLLYGMIAVVLGIILFSSLLGAGVASVSGGNWRQLTRLHKGLAVTGLAIGLVGLLGGGGLLLMDGFPATPPVNAAAAAATNVTPLTLPDPAEPGPYAVLTLTYGNGTDRHRPEYGAGVILTTTSVDGSALAVGASLTVAAFVIATVVQVLTLASDEFLTLRAVDPKTGMTGGAAFAAFLIAGNVINSFMEEGLFRGIMLPHFLQRMRFRTANLLQASLFAAWHLVWPIKAYLNGDVSAAGALAQTSRSQRK